MSSDSTFDCPVCFKLGIFSNSIVVPLPESARWRGGPQGQVRVCWSCAKLIADAIDAIEGADCDPP